MREVISLQIGQCGNMIGSAFWREIAEDHSIDLEGNYYGKSDKELAKIDSYFSTTDTKFFPRAIMIDLEPQTLDEMRCSDLKKMYRTDKFISGHSGTENNWAKGYYTLGAEIKDLVMETVRSSAEECEHLEGFQICHSLGGGTGSGLGSLIINSVREEFPDKILETFSVTPSKNPEIAVEPYNATFSVNKLVENADSCIMLDNDALYKICQENLGMEAPTYSDLNNVASSAIAGITSPIRFPSTLNSSWRKVCMNLVPFPRLHFFTISHMPFYKQQQEKPENSEWKILDLFQRMVNPNNLIISSGHDLCSQRIYSAAAIFRGNYSSKELNDALDEIHNEKSGCFVEWIPDNFLCGTCEVPPKRSLASASSIISGSCVKDTYLRLSEQFTDLFRQKAYTHWYTEEGMDLMEFTEAESNMNDLVSEYSPCCCCCYDEEEYGEEYDEGEEGS
ncbi:unnamed protein product [Blepharisma stoltei]|uniref:Tubulin beta chain n=1 Tax=Blepharisma stoltei TaxID=1481888 RepID=A0AAU9ISZ6_9CILI|nr:unnamed protein product [Blepharisma stoltei]